MKKNELNALKELSLEELRAKETELRESLFKQRLHAATQPVKDNQFAKKLRHDIARVLTCIKQKHVQG